MHLEFLPEGPALVIENTMRVLIIADLHFGIESAFERCGIHIPMQSKSRFERACTCIEKSNADCLVLLGDVKHNVPQTTRQEYREVPSILQAFRNLIPLKVAPGNHDGGIERFLIDEELLPVRGGLIDGVWYLHGHTYPDPSCAGSFLVVGHLHPMISLFDEVGCALYDRAFLFADMNEKCLKLNQKIQSNPTRTLFVPAFNELSGCDILQLKDGSLGPLSRCMKKDEAEVFLTDGTYIGTLGSLEESSYP